jgi:ribosomal protein S27E
MSQPVGLNCLNCGKPIVASFDVRKDAEVKCSNCGRVIVIPHDGKPFVKPNS